jgi:hypothetical protein
MRNFTGNEMKLSDTFPVSRRDGRCPSGETSGNPSHHCLCIVVLLLLWKLSLEHQ